MFMRVLTTRPVNGFYADKPETVALHCGLATLQEQIVEPDDEVTGLERKPAGLP